MSQEMYQRMTAAQRLRYDQQDAARTTRCLRCGERPYHWCRIYTGNGYGVARYLHTARMQLWRSTQPVWRGGPSRYQVRTKADPATPDGVAGVLDTETCTWVHVDGKSTMSINVAVDTAARYEREGKPNG
jgi:hypothetical protein